MNSRNLNREMEASLKAALAAITEADFMGQVTGMLDSWNWRWCHFRPARTKTGWTTPVSGHGKGFPDLLCIRGDDILVLELRTAKSHATQ